MAVSKKMVAARLRIGFLSDGNGKAGVFFPVRFTQGVGGAGLITDKPKMFSKKKGWRHFSEWACFPEKNLYKGDVNFSHKIPYFINLCLRIIDLQKLSADISIDSAIFEVFYFKYSGLAIGYFCVKRSGKKFVFLYKKLLILNFWMFCCQIGRIS